METVTSNEAVAVLSPGPGYTDVPVMLVGVMGKDSVFPLTHCDAQSRKNNKKQICRHRQRRA